MTSRRQSSNERRTATPFEFVQAWQTSSSVAEVASKLGMNTGQVRTRACRYRKRGVPLKEYVSGELPVADWDDVSKFAADLLDQNAKTKEVPSWELEFFREEGH